MTNTATIYRHDLTDVRVLAELHIEANGLDAQGWTFGWVDGKRQIGLCNYRTRTLSLSRQFARILPEDELEQTILHEVAHALTPGAGHGPRWKAVARSIGVRQPKSSKAVSAAPPAKWHGTCRGENCEQTFSRHRLTSGTRNGTCGRCGSGIRWTENPAA